MTGEPVVADAREFVRLVDELGDLEQERTGSNGLSGASAARRTRVERRLMQLLGSEVPVAERRAGVRVVTNMVVRVKVADRSANGRVADVGAGGVYVETELRGSVGDTVDVEIERIKGTLQNGFHLRGQVAWTAPAEGKRRAGLGVCFGAGSEADERRLRRFMFDVLRDHLPRAHE
jgi:Tfp pilus assembly protein PilZ